MTLADRTQHNDGVFFRQEDYAGLWRRLIADAVDVTVALVSLSLVLTYRVALSVPWILVAFAYFVLLKGSSGTLGYRITRVRIVNLQGEVPSVPILTLRLLYSLATGWNGFVWDMMVMHVDPHRSEGRRSNRAS